MAVSALRMRSSARSPSAANAIPTLPETYNSMPAMRKAVTNTSVTRDATRRASASPDSPVASTTNSSPPKRPTLNWGRAVDNRSPRAASSWSPTVWPWLSLTSLKRSRSTKRTAMVEQSAIEESASAISAVSWRRLGRPVSVSCVAS